MSETRNPARTSLAIEAADWYARLRAPDVTEMDAVRFRAWLAGDAGRRREFEAIDEFWADLAAIEHSPEVVRARQEIGARRPKTARPRFGAGWAVAAGLILAAGAAAFFWQQRAANQFMTAVGEQRTVPLTDGSVVTLNTATEIRLHYSKLRRGVELVRGQANFEVAKDPRRPFIVMAGGGEVRAIGTVFDVYKASDKVTITLIEGKVAVTPDSPSFAAERLPADDESSTRDEEIVLAAGEQVSYAPAAKSMKRVTVDVPRVTAWRARKLDFSDTPLAEAVAEANRYSHDQIVLQAPELQDARISGTFEAGKNDLFVEGLQSYFRLKVQRTDDHNIVLTGGQTTEP